MSDGTSPAMAGTLSPLPEGTTAVFVSLAGGVNAEVNWSVFLGSSGVLTAKSVYESFGPLPRLWTPIVSSTMAPTRSVHIMVTMVAFAPGVVGGFLYVTLPRHSFLGSFGFGDFLMENGSFEPAGAVRMS